MKKILAEMNRLPETEDRYTELMNVETAAVAEQYHRSFPQYNVTPLADLKRMAEYLGLECVKVKDESYRFGLNAFKVLGGSFAVANFAAGKAGMDIRDMTFERLRSEEMKAKLGGLTLLSATDGNHGRGVAWTANQLGYRCIIKMPAGTTDARLENIRREQAEVTIENANYDDCVRMVAALAETIGNSVVVQDTAWAGYEEIPAWIMQGYATMAKEAAEQFGAVPTHIFVQAGVGSMAGAVAGYFARRYPEDPPKVIVVEPVRAACHYESALRGDGSTAAVGGTLETISAGLACGEVNPISWDILRNHAAAFLALEDDVTVRGMRMLSAPLKGDPQVVSGESGAAGFGALAAIMLDEENRELREALQLGPDSRVLCFSTEGDTDPERYRNIIWNGLEK
ncbi:MAG: diaminopropionate ammonia-lyase [Firmicutes bacterium]|nr:diaminopropionate ammonia-lyase [Bacillota bacterium]